MFCKKCGFKCTEGDTYCNNCGQNLTEDCEQNSNDVPYKESVPKSPLSSHPVLNLVKGTASSPLFLAMTILFSIGFVLSIISVFSNSYQTIPFDDSFSQYFDYSQIEKISQYAVKGSVIFGFIFLIPMAVMVAGMWTVFASAINRNNDGLSTVGFTMIKAIMIFRVVATCLLFAVLEIFIVVLASFGANYDYGEDINSVASSVIISIALIAAIVMAAVFVLTIIYYLKLSKTISTVNDTIITGIASNKISMFAAVYSFIIAVGVFFTAISNNPMTVFKGLCETASLILVGIVIIFYRKKITAFNAS